MKFKNFYYSIPKKERNDFAKLVGSSEGYLNLAVCGKKKIGLGLADCIVAASRGSLLHSDLPLADRALQQFAIRSSLVA